MREQRNQLRTRLEGYRSWQRAEQERPKLTDTKDWLTTSIERYDERAENLAALLDDIRAELQAIDEESSEVKTRRQRLRELFSELSTPEFDADPVRPSSDELFEAPLESRVDHYRGLIREEQRESTRLQRLLTDIERTTGSLYVGVDESKTIELLEDALDGLEEQEAALDELWHSLVAGLRRQLKGLLRDLEEMKRQVRKLNRTLANRQVSNLSRLEIRLNANASLVERLQHILDQQEQPLFADTQRAEQASRDLARLLEEHPKLELSQLFNLQFKIEDAAGESKVFETLDQIESQGTTVTIKVLIHLELLHRMLDEGRALIPFFLDEVSVLDDQNLSAIVAHARDMHFVPVVASPDARDCVDTLYFLRSNEGDVVLEPKTSRVRLNRPEPDDGTDQLQTTHKEDGLGS